MIVQLAMIFFFFLCCRRQGEYAGLLCIRGYHLSRGDKDRNICIIPVSAHGTNPASAVLAGMKVVVVKSDDKGNIDIEDLRAKVRRFRVLWYHTLLLFLHAVYVLAVFVCLLLFLLFLLF